MKWKKAATIAAALALAGWNPAAGTALADPPPPAPPPAPAPSATPKTTIDTDGTYAVGTDIVPGTYSSAGPVDGGTCYWKRLGNANGNANAIIDNALSKKPQVVEIDPTDTAFKTDGCQPWQKTDAAAPPVGNPLSTLTQLGAMVGSLQAGGGPPPGS
jgi:hypothetical protein